MSLIHEESRGRINAELSSMRGGYKIQLKEAGYGASSMLLKQLNDEGLEISFIGRHFKSLGAEKGRLDCNGELAGIQKYARKLSSECGFDKEMRKCITSLLIETTRDMQRKSQKPEPEQPQPPEQKKHFKIPWAVKTINEEYSEGLEGRVGPVHLAKNISYKGALIRPFVTETDSKRIQMWAVIKIGNMEYQVGVFPHVDEFGIVELSVGKVKKRDGDDWVRDYGKSHALSEYIERIRSVFMDYVNRLSWVVEDPTRVLQLPAIGRVTLNEDDKEVLALLFDNTNLDKPRPAWLDEAEQIERDLGLRIYVKDKSLFSEKDESTIYYKRIIITPEGEIHERLLGCKTSSSKQLVDISDEEEEELFGRAFEILTRELKINVSD